MATFLGNDLRKHVVDAYFAGQGSYREIAEVFGVGEASVNRVWNRYRKTGLYTQPPRRGGRKSKIGVDRRPDVEEMVKENPDAFFDEYVAFLPGTKVAAAKAQRKSISFCDGTSITTPWFHAQEKSASRSRKNVKEGRPGHQKVSSCYQLDSASKACIFFDKSGFQAHRTRSKARALVGQPATVIEPTIGGKNVTVVGAPALRGPVLMKSYSRAITGYRFASFFGSHLFPRLLSGGILVLDNLAAHKTETVRRIARQWEVKLLFLLPYSPAYNPIEKVWAIMKQKLRGRLNRAKKNF